MPDRDRVPYRAIARGGLAALAFIAVVCLIVGLESGLVPWLVQVCTENPYGSGNEQCTPNNIVYAPFIYASNFLNNEFGAIGALAGIAVACFTWTLKRSTDRLWEASLDHAKVAERIGQAQARAYVNIKTASVIFRDDLVPGAAHPTIEIYAENTGQSPARKFIWRPTLRYYDEGKRRTRGLPVWVEAPGINIAVGKAIQSRLISPGMEANQFIGGKILTMDDTSTFIVHLRIEFEYEDVFASKIFDTAFFTGAAAGAFTFEGTKWICGELSPHPSMSDWDALPNGITEQNR